MSDWRKRGKKQGDVVYFPYTSEATASAANEVFLWDVDKTYLDTNFKNLKGIWRTATEKADSKKNVPGANELVRCLSEHHQKQLTPTTKGFPIFFITASPPQIEHKISQKLKIDGVEPFGVFCKDNLENLRPRRLWRITKHVGYKVQALLQLRAFLSESVRIVLFGDDGESDAIIYSLFSDICTRRIDTSEIRQILNFFSTLDSQVDLILRLQDLVPSNDPVEKIYINLAEDTDSDYYLKFGRRIVPTYDAFQAALDLYQDDRIGLSHVTQVANRLIHKYDYSKEEIERSYDDMIRRGRLSSNTCEKVDPELKTAQILPADFAPSVPPRAEQERAGRTLIKLDGTFDPWVPERIDYTTEYR
jgi:hypothetical protein